MEEKLAQLWETYLKNNDMKLLCENLYKESCEVADKFTTNYYFSLSETSRIEFINTLKETKKSKEIFLIVATVIVAIVNTKSPDKYFPQLLKDIIITAKSSGKFPDYKCKALNHLLLEKTAGNILTINYSNWSDKELEKFYGFLLETYRKLGAGFKCKDKVEQWLEQYNFAPLSTIGEEVASTKVAPAKKTSPKVSSSININELKNLFEKMFDDKISGLMTEITTTKSALQKFNHSILEKNVVLDLYTEKLQAQAQEIITLKKMLVDKDKVLEELQAGKLTVTKTDEHYTAEIEDLKARLKASFQADDITKKQDLITLKKNIGAAIKLQYVDFCENKDAVFNEDNYEALKNNLEYIFRGLKRYGIEL